MPVRGGRVAQVTNNKSGVNCNCPLVHVNEQKGCDSFLFIPVMCCTEVTYSYIFLV
jgi:hypothetical protein